MKLNTGVAQPTFTQPAIMIALMVADGIWRNIGQELVVTSMSGDGRGVHIQIHGLTSKGRGEVVNMLKLNLGYDNDYQIEADDYYISIRYDNV